MFIISLKKSYKTLIYFLTYKPRADIEVCVRSMFVSNLVLNLICYIQNILFDY